MSTRYTWNVYLEPADTDDPRRFIGTIQALYEGQALELASQYFETPSHDLIVKRSDLDASHLCSRHGCTFIAPYQCAECRKFLCFGHTLYANKIAYCSEHVPQYREDEQW